MKTIFIERKEFNFKSSGSYDNLKLCPPRMSPLNEYQEHPVNPNTGKKVGGEKQFGIGSDVYFFYDIINDSKPEFFLYRRQDLLDYLNSAENEYINPTQEYCNKKFLKNIFENNKEFLKTLDENIFINFYINICTDSRYLGFCSRGDREKYYNFIRPLISSNTQVQANGVYTKLVFFKYRNLINNKIYFYLKPIFMKPYSTSELASFLSDEFINYNDDSDSLDSIINTYAMKYRYQLNTLSDDQIQSIINDEQCNLHGADRKKVSKKLLNAKKWLNDLISKEPEKYQMEIERYVENNGQSNKTLQQIFYGAPGTGKSYAVNEVTKQYPDTIRTTFHPDSDYSTFVGVYKPSTTTVDRYGLNGIDTVALKYPDGEHIGDPITESKIEYKFVKQAFLKAYIKAWQSFIQFQHSTPKTTSSIVLTSHTLGEEEKWFLNSMNEMAVYYTKQAIIPLDQFETYVKRLWNTIQESDNPAKYRVENHERYEATACCWYMYKISIDGTADDCWEAVLDRLKEEPISFSPTGKGMQRYTIELNGDTVTITSNSTAWRETVEKKYNEQSEKKYGSVHFAIAQKLKEYQTSFDEAWEMLMKEVEADPNSVADLFDPNELLPQFLVIEEINRGNCAQVFGDLFQLLDRKDGFSSYPIEADEDIRKALLEENPEDGLSFGKDGLSLSLEQIDYINQHYDQGDDVANKIQQGEVLVLPPNLYIWATMNTSDQSLFPIDSAFKRRWDWVYVPIQYKETFKIGNEEKQNRSYSFVIKIGGNEYSWIEFLKQVNQKICNLTDSEDKQMGNYFVDVPNGETEIDEKTFKNKVMFYLWNDICKDERGNNKNFYKTKDGEFFFNQLFEPNGQQLLIDFLDNIDGIKITNSKPTGNTPPTSTPSGNTPNEGDKQEQ